MTGRLVMLAMTAVLGVSGSVGCSRWVDFERMRQQRRADPYADSAFFSDGTTMRVPPAGTVTADMRDGSSVIATGVERGLAVREIPMPVTQDALARGRHEYEIFCAVCHGSDGSGQSVMASNIPGSARLSLLGDDAVASPAGELFVVTSRGKDRMPRFDWALSPTDRWAVVAYLRMLQSRRSAAAGAAP